MDTNSGVSCGSSCQTNWPSFQAPVILPRKWTLHNCWPTFAIHCVESEIRRRKETRAGQEKWTTKTGDSRSISSRNFKCPSGSNYYLLARLTAAPAPTQVYLLIIEGETFEREKRKERETRREEKREKGKKSVR